MVSKFAEGIPKGRIIPFYLTDEGDVYPIYFRSREELEMCEQMVSIVLQHKVVVNTKHSPINPPEQKISIFEIDKKKN